MQNQRNGLMWKKTDNENMPVTQSDGDDDEDNSGDGTVSYNGSVNADVEEVTTRKQHQDHILRNRWQLKEPTKFHDCLLLTQGKPASYDKAMNYEDGAKWKAAMMPKCNPLWKVELSI